jgi:hypothetical protein
MLLGGDIVLPQFPRETVDISTLLGKRGELLTTDLQNPLMLRDPE